MKPLLILAIILMAIFSACKTVREEKVKLTPNYYKNLYTQAIYSQTEMNQLVDSIFLKYSDSTKGPSHIHFLNYEIIQSNDSIIQPFKYDFRVGIDYILRSKKYDKIGTNIPTQKLRTITGDSIQIGGIQDKPMVINLWFINCWGCVAEIPALNSLQKKYNDKVNFVALTFDNEKDVRKFLKKQEFDFTHAASKNWKREETSLRPFIKTIESYPYPETIFIDKNGTIRFVEGMIPQNDSIELMTIHFEMIIEHLLVDE